MRLHVLEDIAAWFPDWKPEVIIDVGACVGGHAREFAAAFPDAKIFAFEPFPKVYRTLKEIPVPNILPSPLALSSKTGRALFTEDRGGSGNRIDKDGTREIDTVRGDEFFKGVGHVGYLKIDTEGHDLEVLKGFGSKLSKIDFIQVECAMNRHVHQCLPYRVLEDYLVSQGFYLFYFYEACFEFKQGPKIKRVISLRGNLLEYTGGAPLMRRVDAVFINPNMVGPLEG